MRCGWAKRTSSPIAGPGKVHAPVPPTINGPNRLIGLVRSVPTVEPAPPSCCRLATAKPCSSISTRSQPKSPSERTPLSSLIRPDGMAPKPWWFPTTSHSYRCRRAHLNSTARRTSGSSCARIGCQTGFSNPSTISSTTAATLGTHSSTNPGRLCPSRDATGQKSVTQSEDWYNSGVAIPRKPDELPVARFAEQKCMGCHTTGFDFMPVGTPPASAHWNMKGNGELAVGCERCHGPGSKHVDLAKQKAAAGSKLDPEHDPTLIVHGLKDLSLDQQNQVCGQCHARLGGKSQGVLGFPDTLDGKLFLPGDFNLAERALFWSYVNPNSIPGQGFDNFWPDGRGKKSRTQWQDHIAGAHAVKAGASCTTCHTFHGDAVSKDPQQTSKLRQPPKELCESCHHVGGLAKQPNMEMYSGLPNLVASSQHADQGVACADCHMGAVGQRMTKTAAGTTDTAAAFDVSFHGTSIIPASPGTPPFGLFDERGNCEVWHTDQRVMANGTVPPKKTPAELLDYVNKIKNSTRLAVNQIQARGATNKNTDAKTELQLSNARANINMILLDGSMGFHNTRVNQAGDVSPEGGVGDCLRLANLWVELACRSSGANCTGEPFNPVTGPITEPNPPVCLTPKN